MGLRALRRVRAIGAVFVLALLSLAAPVGATATTFSDTSPFFYVGANGCTGETFTGTGTMHFLESANLSTSGALQNDLDVHIDGLQAMTPMGKRYVVQDVFDDHFVFAGAAEETFDITAHYIRVGEDGMLILGDDFYERLHTHITANDNGIVTSYSVTTTDLCQ